MTYRIELTGAARRALVDTLPESVAAACWEFIRGPLAENPYCVGKPLRDRLAGNYSARRGQFRVIYQIFDDRIVVRIIRVAHWCDVYR
ncbi:type II toxin-antitoxin system RelE family toxin [Rhodococcoides kyotonense]|uniref:mRNA-degrading endonuclease RelE, toxin component of the RelBE toxin-antitoxin system n=1 Tax=Rhodococcoides kyotonense TaxID=398843 RepID=A0A239I8Q3_9NOCA|nr:type II toxin-antitoxin system RelE/ParE family toxin [Rhodococcus kyotonensis]SNS89980.1 mRNA-degrading endonuclease RelE, toxin component of the RelBE toxin-antitoxin system [Rhodococcus kyotonensis]